MFRALRHRDFRWFILSQACATTGSWMQQVALGWLVYRLTDSAFLLGLVGGAGTLASFLVAPLAGVLADRLDRRRGLVVLQALAAAQATVLALLVHLHLATVANVLVLGVLLGAIQGFDWPVRQSLLVHLVKERADLGNAIALNSTVFNLARIVGPALAGLLLTAGKDALCFGLNAVAGGLAVLFLVRLRARRRGGSATVAAGGILREFREGAGYLWREPVVRRGVALVALASGCIMPYATFLPLFAVDVFGGAAWLFGTLAAAPAVGAVAGGLLLASRREQTGLSRRIALAGASAALSLTGLGFSRWLTVSLGTLVLLGGAMMIWTSSINTQLQTVIPDGKRGRVMSLFSMALMGALPVGCLVFGALAERLGVAPTVVLGGIAALVGNGWLHREALAGRWRNRRGEAGGRAEMTACVGAK